MPAIRLTMAEALVRYLCAQYVDLDGRALPLFGGVFAIFGHGNVAGLGPALHGARRRLPTYRSSRMSSMSLFHPGLAGGSPKMLPKRGLNSSGFSPARKATN